MIVFTMCPLPVSVNVSLAAVPIISSIYLEPTSSPLTLTCFNLKTNTIAADINLRSSKALGVNH